MVQYPEASAVVDYFRGRIPRLRSAADPSKPLAMPHKAFLSLVHPLPSPNYWKFSICCGEWAPRFVAGNAVR